MRENLLSPHGLLFLINSKGSFYMHHPTDRITHTMALAGTRNSSMGSPPRRISFLPIHVVYLCAWNVHLCILSLCFVYMYEYTVWVHVHLHVHKYMHVQVRVYIYIYISLYIYIYIYTHISIYIHIYMSQKSCTRLCVIKTATFPGWLQPIWFTTGGWHVTCWLQCVRYIRYYTHRHAGC